MMSSVAIIGGGISGLSAAYYLTKTGSSLFNKVIFLEASSRLGGWVNTLRLEDGSLFERGPRSIRGVGRAGLNTLELADELGLAKSILPLPRNHVASKNRYIFVNGHLCKLPNSLKAVLTRQDPFSRPLFIAGMKEPFQPKSKTDDETVDSFFQRRFGGEIAKYAANPLCRGIFAGDSMQLSMRSCFPIFYNFEQKFGSIIGGSLFQPRDKTVPDSKLIRQYQSEKWAMWSLTSGLQLLPETIGSYLNNNPSVDVQLGARCSRIEFTPSGKAKVHLGNKELTVDHVVSAIPSFALSSLLEKDHPTLSGFLNDIRFASVAVVNLQYRSNVLGIVGFGHLIPSHVMPSVLGVLYESHTFPEHNGPDKSTRITVMMGGAWFEDSFGDPDSCDVDKIVELAVKTVSDQLFIQERPYRIFSNIQKMCIPQYKVGHHKTVEQLNEYIVKNSLPLTLTGSSYKGVSVNDCIYNARLDVESLVRRSQPTTVHTG